jgi:hypothetical protein
MGLHAQISRSYRVGVKDELLTLGFLIVETEEHLLVNANDAEHQQLIDRLKSRQITLEQFMIEAKHRFGPDKSNCKPDGRPIIRINNQLIEQKIIKKEQVQELEPIFIGADPTSGRFKSQKLEPAELGQLSSHPSEVTGKAEGSDGFSAPKRMVARVEGKIGRTGDRDTPGSKVVKTRLEENAEQIPERHESREGHESYESHESHESRGGHESREGHKGHELSELHEAKHELVEEVIVPQWKNLPPTDLEDWVEINESVYQERPDGWAVAAASRRGKIHAHEGSHRDDAFAVGFQEGWSIIVAADGAGSYKLSRVGAKLSCQVVVDNLKILLRDFKLKEIEGAALPEEADLIKIKLFLTDSIQKAIKAVKAEAAKRKVEFEFFSTTVLTALTHKWMDKCLVASIQVGDGAIVVWHGGDKVAILGQADSGDYAGETKFITSKGIEDELEHKVFFTIKSDVDAVAVMTDGVADDFFPAETVMPKMLAHVYNELIGSEKPDEELLNWLSYERRGSFDDRTLVVLHRR